MVVNKRRKVHKYRASVTHGGGHRKKRRGAGSRGGVGNAGSGKRAGQKVAGMNYKLGPYGFNRGGAKPKGETVNVGYFTSEKLAVLESEGKISKDGDMYVLDLAKLGYAKMLGTGACTAAFKVVGTVSAKAAEKIQSAGGSVE